MDNVKIGMVAYGEHCLLSCDNNPKAALAKFLAGTGDETKAAGNADALANGVLEKFEKLMPRVVQFGDVSDAAYSVALQIAAHGMQWLHSTLAENGHILSGCDLKGKGKATATTATACIEWCCLEEAEAVMQDAEAARAEAERSYGAAKRLNDESRRARYEAYTLLVETNRKIDAWEKAVAAVPKATRPANDSWATYAPASRTAAASVVLPFRKPA